MNPTTLSRLLDINRQFYQAFATQFSLTRQRLQPGVTHILEQIDRSANVLDLGCGNGELARQLARRGIQGTYTGLDFSPALLEHASAGQSSSFHFLQADLSRPDWDASLHPGQSDLILAFAVLHHLPGVELRQRVLHQVRALLSPQGQFIHSEWQFLNSLRLKARIQPWETMVYQRVTSTPGITCWIGARVVWACAMCITFPRPSWQSWLKALALLSPKAFSPTVKTAAWVSTRYGRLRCRCHYACPL